MRAAIYARVSTDRQNRDQTIDSQLAALRQWARDGGHDLRPEHTFTDDGYSGARLDPALDRLRDAAHQGEVEVVAGCDGAGVKESEVAEDVVGPEEPPGDGGNVASEGPTAG